MRSVFTRIAAALLAVITVCTALSACGRSSDDYYDPDFGGFNFSLSQSGRDRRDRVIADDADDIEDTDDTDDRDDATTAPATEAPTEESIDLTRFDGYECYTDLTKTHRHYLKITSTEMRIYYASFNGGRNEWEERYFVIDLTTSDLSDSILTPSKIMDDHNTDKTDSFKELWFLIGKDYTFISMDVDRDENKLAGGAQQNLEDGSYFFFAPK